MKVQARWTIAYKNKSYNGGEIFELDEKDYEKFKNDVVIIKNERPSPKIKKTKTIKSKRTK